MVFKISIQIKNLPMALKNLIKCCFLCLGEMEFLGTAKVEVKLPLLIDYLLLKLGV
jgi:hypothetical protein